MTCNIVDSPLGFIVITQSLGPQIFLFVQLIIFTPRSKRFEGDSFLKMMVTREPSSYSYLNIKKDVLLFLVGFCNQ